MNLGRAHERVLVKRILKQGDAMPPVSLFPRCCEGTLRMAPFISPMVPLQKDRLVARRPDRDDRKFRPGEFGYRLEITPRPCRQLLPGSSFAGGRFPPGKFHVDRLA